MTVICYIKLALFLNIGNILALLRDLGKSHIARALFIKLDSIGARILMLDIRMNSYGDIIPAYIVARLRLVIILVISGIDDGWKFAASGI